MISFEGGCHCGRVRFRVHVQPGAPANAVGEFARSAKPRRGGERGKAPHEKGLEAYDCNCSICAKKGFVHLIVTKDAFELLSGEADLTTYTFNTGVAKHTFCRVCGIHPFYTPRSHPDGVDVNVRALDGDALARFTIVPFDGQDWEANVDAIRR